MDTNTNSAMKVAKELVDSGDVNPMEIENELISNVVIQSENLQNGQQKQEELG